MSKSKALKFGLITGGIIAILWFLKYKIATPVQDGGGSGEREDESAGGGGVGGGIGGSTDLSGLNHLANNLPGNQTPATSATSSSGTPTNIGTSSIASSLLGSTSTSGSGRNEGQATMISTSVAPRTNVSSQLGFNGFKTVGFADDERKFTKF